MVHSKKNYERLGSLKDKHTKQIFVMGRPPPSTHQPHFKKDTMTIDYV